MPEKAKITAEVAESAATQRWQSRTRRWMQAVITGIIVFFLVASAWQVYHLQQRIENAPEFKAEFLPPAGSSPEMQQWRTLASLEAHAIQQRYHQANVILMSRIWASYLGFVTGMTLAIVGAAFILGKLRESTSEISGKSELWQVSIASTSPGLVMVVLGTILMMTTILTNINIAVNDGPLYIGSATGAPMTFSKPSPAPGGLTDALRKLERSRAADSSVASKDTTP